MRVLDRSREDEVSIAALEMTDELGATPEEAVPGLMKAAFRLSEQTSNPEQALDEAASLFADGLWADDGGPVAPDPEIW